MSHVLTNSCFLMLLSVMSMTCSERGTHHVLQWNDEQILEWYKQSKWNNELPLKPDSSIDMRSFVQQNLLNPSSWEAAYKFIKETDFNKMSLGKYELAEDGTYANIAEYKTKVSSHFEAHRKYIDIQLLSKGKEYVMLTSVNSEERRQVANYDDKKDIEFFDTDNSISRLLAPGNFMVFFPSDAHKPCMMVDSVEFVRKVVVKIPYVL